MLGSRRLEELAVALIWWNGELVLALWSYFDESGHSEDPNCSVLSVGGAVSSVGGWKRLVPEWNAVLKEFSVSQLHMKEFAHSKREFVGWTEDKRRAFLSRLVGLMTRDVDTYIGRVMDLRDDWRESPGALRERLKNPYHGCFIFCVNLAMSYAKNLDPAEELNVVMAHHPEYSGWANDVFQAMREGPDGHRLGSLSFDTPAQLVQLQTADLVAYELQHYTTDARRKGKLGRRWALQQLLRKPHDFGRMQLRTDIRPEEPST